MSLSEQGIITLFMTSITNKDWQIYEKHCKRKEKLHR